MGRPRKADRRVLLEALERYIAETDIPIVAEFAALQKLSRPALYEMAELSDAIKRCTSKKEAALERMALRGDVNVTMAIFSLKQLGWTDRQEQTHKGDPTAPVELHLTGSDVHG